MPNAARTGYTHPCWLGTTGELWSEASASLAVQRSLLRGVVSVLHTPAWALHVGLSGALQDQTVVCERAFTDPAWVKVLDFGVEPPTCRPPSNWSVVARHTRQRPLPSGDVRSWLPATRRKQCARFEREGGTVSCETGAGNMWDEVVRLHTASRERKALNARHDALIDLVGCLANEPWTYAVVARDAEGTALASGGFVQVSDDVVVYAFGGQSRSRESGRASVAMLAEAMRVAFERGARTFDFGGSLDPGVDQFYREFGGTVVPTWRWVHAPWWLRWALGSKWRDWTLASPHVSAPVVSKPVASARPSR